MNLINKKNFAILLTGTILAVLLTGCTSLENLKKAQADNYNLQQQLNAESDQITDLQSRTRQLEQSLADKQSELDNSTKKLTDQFNTVNGRLADITSERDNLLKSNKDLQTSLSAKSDELSKMIAKLNGDNQILQSQVIQLKADNKNASDKIDSLLSDNNALKQQLADQQKSIDDLKATADRVYNLENYNNDLKQQLDALQVRYNNELSMYGDLSNANNELNKAISSKSEELSQTIAKLTKENETLSAENDALKKTADEQLAAAEREKARVEETYKQAQEQLKNEIARGEIEIQNIKSVLTFNIAERVFFDSGDAAIKAQGRDVLKKLGNLVNKLPEKLVRVEGHTDNVPIGANLLGKYPSNWELSAARAINVIRFLQDRTGVDPLRLVPVAYSEYRPIASNDNPEGRSKNRRIEILLVDKEYNQLIQKKELAGN